MRTRADVYPFGCDCDALRAEAIGFIKKRLRIDYHAVAKHASLALMHDSRWQKMQHEGSITYLHRVTGIVAALIANDDVKALGQQIDDLAFAFIAPLGADDRDNHKTQKTEVRGQPIDTKQARLQVEIGRAHV